MDDKTKKFIESNSVSEGFLQDWYINSVISSDNLTWTEEHIAELVGDFVLIPKELLDK